MNPSTAGRRPSSASEWAIVLWSIGGVLALLVQAIVRLLPRALEPILDGSLDAVAGLAYLASIAGLAYSEGYRGFQQRFSPRVVVRALHLARHPEPLLVIAAPLHAMALIHATRRRLLGSWSLLLGIIGLIVLVSKLEQPWRGAVDAGVVVGLSWGAVATLVLLIRACRGSPPEVDPDLPKPG
ncbi:MAG TPA: hypothetical protein VK034_02140 [Enhygromyxa sp.]|nr:hypothetical protein [Enhygromyxa sp.]